MAERHPFQLFALVGLILALICVELGTDVDGDRDGVSGLGGDGAACVLLGSQAATFGGAWTGVGTKRPETGKLDAVAEAKIHLPGGGFGARKQSDWRIARWRDSRR